MVIAREFGRLVRMNVDDPVPMIVALGLVRMRRHGRAVRRPGLVRMAGHGRPVQHERRHRDEHDARDETT
jgi:hypothetical protein